MQLLAALATQVRVVPAQRAIANEDETGTALALLQGLDLRGCIVTGDARLTQKPIVETILAQGGNYVPTVKANQPTLQEDIATHGGRIEVHTLQASSALTAGYTGWVGLRQVFCLERRRRYKSTGQGEEQVVYGLASLPPMTGGQAARHGGPAP